MLVKINFVNCTVCDTKNSRKKKLCLHSKPTVKKKVMKDKLLFWTWRCARFGNVRALDGRAFERIMALSKKLGSVLWMEHSGMVSRSNLMTVFEAGGRGSKHFQMFPLVAYRQNLTAILTCLLESYKKPTHRLPGIIGSRTCTMKKRLLVIARKDYYKQRGVGEEWIHQSSYSEWTEGTYGQKLLNGGGLGGRGPLHISKKNIFHDDS